MVEFTSTTPSTAGNTQDGPINSFSSQLDAGTLAAVEEPNQSGGGIESYASYASDAKEKEVNDVITWMLSSQETINKSVANPDGFLNDFQLVQAIYTEQYWPGYSDVQALGRGYGSKMPSDYPSAMYIGRNELVAMFADGVLSIPDGYVKGQSRLTVNIGAMPIERVIRGGSYYDRDSHNDLTFSQDELAMTFSSLGLTVTPDQTQSLLDIYGDGNFLTQADMQTMRSDGFLNTGTTLSNGAALDWEAISGELIADAMCTALGLAPGTELLAEQFYVATDKVFDDFKGVSREQAVFLTRVFGTGGKLNRDQVAKLFDLGNISIQVVDGQNAIQITVKTTAENMDFANNTEAANYIMLYDTNNDGLLYTPELRAAITPRLVAGVDLTDKDMQTYMDAYGEKRSDGNMSITRDGVLAMLNDGSLSIEGPSQLPSRFVISLDAMPISRVLLAASYGDSVSLNDGLVSKDELIKLFATLGLTLTVNQAVFLTKVYSNGGSNDTLLTQFNVGQMCKDGFLITGAVKGVNCSMNWSAIDGTLIAREIFRSLGLDPNVENVSVDATAFNEGFKVLYGDMQTLKRADDLTGYFGFEDKLTVAQMGNALNAVNTDVDDMNAGLIDVSNPSDTASDASSRTLAEKNIYTVFDYAEVAAADATITKIAAVSGVAENVVRGMLRGTLSQDVAVANGGYNIVGTVSAAIAGGQAGISTIIDTISAALSSSLVGLSDAGTKVLNQLVTSAKAGGEEVAVRTLSTWAGMTVENARAQIEDLATKGSLLDMARNLQIAQVKAMLPDADLAIADAKVRYQNLIANIQTDATTLQSLANEGYTFNSDKKLTKDGLVLSEIETQAAFGKYARVDIAIDINSTTPLPDGLTYGFANGAQVRFFLAYGGQDSNGDDKLELRIRILTIGLGASVNSGPAASTFGLDLGIATVHDLVIPINDNPQILWNSSIAALGQTTTTGELASDLARTIGIDIPALPYFPGLLGKVGYETGGGGAATVSYNLSSLGNNWYVPFISELSGVVGGVVVGGAVAFKYFAALEAGQSALNYFRNNTAMQSTLSISAMATAFLADVITASALMTTSGTDKAQITAGGFWWGAQLADFYIPDVNGTVTKVRIGVQENVGYSPGSIT